MVLCNSMQVCSCNINNMSTGYICNGCLKKIQRLQPKQYPRLPARRAHSTAHLDRTVPLLRKSLLSTPFRHQSTASAPNDQIQYQPPSVKPLAQRYEQKYEKDIRKFNQVLDEDDLFHPFSQSPLPEMRRRAAYIKSHAYCPHPDHQRTRMPVSPTDPEHRKTADQSRLPPRHVRFECPDCGIPTYCSEEHWADDYELHMEICDTLRQINEDDHDLRSRRRFREFENLPTWEGWEIAVSMADWDSYLYTQEYRAVDSDRSQRHLTAQLTYPMTINSIIHEHSPYHQRKSNRITNEGLRSFTALRHSLHPFKDHRSGGLLKYARPRPPPTRIFILGARSECALNADIWNQLPNAYLDNHMHIDLNLIGPETFIPQGIQFPERKAGNPFGGYTEDRINPDKMMKLITYKERYQTMHDAQYFHPFDPYFDCFVLFHPGLGHPASSHEWQDALPQLLATKCPIICTGYSQWDMERDRKWVHEQSNGEYDVLITPGENLFRSLKWDLNDLEPQDVSCGNWGVWAFRGKRFVALSYPCNQRLTRIDMRQRQQRKRMSLEKSLVYISHIDNIPIYMIASPSLFKLLPEFPRTNPATYG